MSTLLRGLAATLFFLAACGPSGSDDDDDNPIDAPSGSIDAPGGNIDAPGTTPDAPMGGSTLGMACTGDGQGTCPTGFACLNLQGGSGSWCSKTCTGQADMSCGTGYTGPGFPGCLLSVTPSGGGPAQNYCAIICNDAPGAPTLCPGGPTQCNNTCPTPLMCNGNLTDQNNMVVGKVCE